MAIISSEYKSWIGELKQRIRQSQIKAAVKVNTELLKLYWEMGSDIVERQKNAQWGDGFLKQLSHDLSAEFPEIAGFSVRNLQQICKWYNFYNQRFIIAKQLVSQLQENFFSIPWGHHILIMQRCKDIDKALFYIQQTVENNWSRTILDWQIDSNLYDRQGKSISNFSKTLPSPQSDLAQQVTKDPYIFDFLSLRQEYDEKELEEHLITNMTQFLMQLGVGFCYYGKQVHLNVGGDDFYIDLLFYHVKLHCYVVVELKTTKFKPEHIGQLKFYVTAVDRELKAENDAPTIGLLICKDKNDVVAEYTLSNIDTPIGISSYEIYDKLTADYKSSLPTIEEIEAQLKDKEI